VEQQRKKNNLFGMEDNNDERIEEVSNENEESKDESQ